MVIIAKSQSRITLVSKLSSFVKLAKKSLVEMATPCTEEDTSNGFIGTKNANDSLGIFIWSK